MLVVLRQLAEEIRPELSKTLADQTALLAWIDGLQGKQSQSGSVGQPFGDPSNALLVLDAQGRILASNFPEKFPTGQAYTGQPDMAVSDVLSGVMKNSAQALDLAARENNQYLVAAVPVLDSAGHLVGVIFLRWSGVDVLNFALSLLRTSFPIAE